MKRSDRVLSFEICVDSVESAIAAQDGGADRVELCDNLFEGGTTPSFGSIAMAREMLSIKLHVIIRPRGGDFLYTDAEFEIMKRDIEATKRLGVDGVVIGLLNADGNIDAERTRELVSLARPMSVTFHRAFDVCLDPFEALETLIDLGIDRVLTSGQKPTATEGAEMIGKLVKQADDRIIIMACGSLDDANIADVISATGVKELHFTAFETIESAMQYRNDAVAMGSDNAGSEYIRNVTSAEKVKRIIKAAQ
ncbi:MAG: copper homeostasis protein CutC [Acidobacteria bacterium]|nr:copper homeostasis protein CutC [Acidobacteriota bacterium]